MSPSSSMPITAADRTEGCGASAWPCGNIRASRTSLDGTFNEAHVLAISEGNLTATAKKEGIDGPLFIGNRYACPVRACIAERHLKCSRPTAPKS